MKKRRIVLLMATCMMAFGAQSAFATSGQYDTPQTANPIAKGAVLSGYIDAGSDQDWYVVQNNTSSGQIVTPRLLSPISVNLDFDVIRISSSGTYSNERFADQGAGGLEGGFFGFTLNPGDLVYIRVFPHTSSDYSSTNSYILQVN
ncbi:hypothetical protein ACFSR7_02335 [Cohnella sp. GCM10020058]|uniref:hypothetical protein n=1 Tax=Cohnella sp. GCM10020058 TaxID=3317330 RepID=UPI00363C0A3F